MFVRKCDVGFIALNALNSPSLKNIQFLVFAKNVLLFFFVGLYEREQNDMPPKTLTR